MSQDQTSNTDYQDPFIQDRLQSLHDIDAKLVAILNHSSSALSNLISLKKSASNQDQVEKIQQEFQSDVQSFYSDLEYASIHLKKEIKTLDDRVGKTDANGITMLPININKKATWAGEEKLKSQLDALDQLLEETDKST